MGRRLFQLQPFRNFIDHDPLIIYSHELKEIKVSEIQIVYSDHSRRQIIFKSDGQDTDLPQYFCIAIFRHVPRNVSLPYTKSDGIVPDDLTNPPVITIYGAV